MVGRSFVETEETVGIVINTNTDFLKGSLVVCCAHLNV